MFVEIEEYYMYVWMNVFGDPTCLPNQSMFFV